LLQEKITKLLGARGAHFLNCMNMENVKIRKYLKKTSTDTQMKFYKIVARTTLLYGSETWVTKK
jgi:hypothetical protein